MNFLLTSNEPETIKDLFLDEAIIMPMDFDMMLYTKPGKVAIERKAVPGDLLASVDDGRLSREITSMREQADFSILILHGRMIFRNDGTLVIPGHNRKTHWTKGAIKNMLRTIEYVEGVYIEEAETDEELVDLIYDLQEYFDKLRHTSIKSRPSIETQWIKPTKDERILYFYQGLPGCSVVRARALFKNFPMPELLYQASYDDISSIYRFGKSTADRIYNFLHQEEDK